MKLFVDTLASFSMDIDVVPFIYMIRIKEHWWSRWKYLTNADGEVIEFTSRKEVQEAVKELFGVDIQVPRIEHQNAVLNNAGVINYCNVMDTIY